MKCNIPQSKLLNATLELLEKRPKDMTLQWISQQTSLPYCWLMSLRMRPVGTYSAAVDRVECLYEFLSYKKLKV